MQLAEWARPDRDFPLFIEGGSFYGVVRNRFGLELVSRSCTTTGPFEEIDETLADGHRRAGACAGRRCALKAAGMWRTGTGGGPPARRPALQADPVPHCKRITATLNK